MMITMTRYDSGCMLWVTFSPSPIIQPPTHQLETDWDAASSLITQKLISKCRRIQCWTSPPVSPSFHLGYLIIASRHVLVPPKADSHHPLCPLTQPKRDLPHGTMPPSLSHHHSTVPPCWSHYATLAMFKAPHCAWHSHSAIMPPGPSHSDK